MIGKKLGRYEILGKLGAGGMGEVYRARDLSLGRDIALKLLPEHVREDPDRLRRFEHEARAASALNHPNIVTIYDIGQSDGTPYIAMELVEGQTLRNLLTLRPLLTKRALALAAQAAEGLARAHGVGIIHRDLKPENLMVTRDGFVKILDFGLAKLHEPDPLLAADAPTEPATRPGMLMGTVGYMSPEQARGFPVDFRSDQFACGSILYEMATGKRAFEKETPVQTLAAIIESQPEPIQNLNPEVPPPFRWIVERCLRKNPEERYASTVDLARELRNVHDRLEEVSSGPHSGPRSLWSFRLGRGGWLRRPAALAAATSLVLGALALILVAGVARMRRPSITPAAKHLAVLPCKAIGSTPADQAYCDGLTQTLTAKLAPLTAAHALQITPMSTVRDRSVDSPTKAGTEFGASLALEGSVLRAGDTLRVNYALIDLHTHAQLDAYSVAAGAAEQLTVEDRLAEWAARALALELNPHAQEPLRTPSTQVAAASELFMQGRGFLLNHQKAENIEHAIACFRKALELDSSYSPAQAGLGEAYWHKYRASMDRQWVDLARQACQQALHRDPNLAAAHICLGTIQKGTGEYVKAAAAFTRALTLEPTSDEGYEGLALAQELLGNVDAAERTYLRAIALRPHYWASRQSLGNFYRAQGRLAEALVQHRQMVALAPESTWAHAILGGTSLYLGQYDEAIASFRKSIELGPSWAGYANWGVTYIRMRRFKEATAMLEQARAFRSDCRTYSTLARAYYWEGQRVPARALHERAVRLCQNELSVNPRDVDARLSLAEAYAKLGQRAAALEHLQRAELGSNAHRLFYAAVVYNQVGDRAKALARLEQAVAQRLPVAELRGWIELDDLRDEPRFQTLLPPRRVTQATPGS